MGIKTALRGLESWPSFDGVCAAESPGAVIVSVDVVEFAPGVTEVGDKAQVAAGVDPVTAHES